MPNAHSSRTPFGRFTRLPSVAFRPLEKALFTLTILGLAGMSAVWAGSVVGIGDAEHTATESIKTLIEYDALAEETRAWAESEAVRSGTVKPPQPALAPTRSADVALTKPPLTGAAGPTKKTNEARTSMSEPQGLQRDPPPLVSDVPFSQPIRLGVQHSLLKTSQSDIILKTREHLARVYGRQWITVFYLDDKDLSTALRSGQVDFFIADADYFTIEEQLLNLEAIASLWPSESESPQLATGSVIVARKTHKAGEVAPTLHDLATRKIVASSPTSLAGWLAAAVEFKQHHVFMDDDPLPNTTFTDGNVRKVLSTMAEKPATIGVLPACEMERMAERGELRLSDYWVINPRRNDGLNCVHSTALYPSWVFGGVKTVRPTVRKAITTALFMMEGKGGENVALPVMELTPDPHVMTANGEIKRAGEGYTMGPVTSIFGAEWTTPVTNRPIYDLFYTLKMGPYSDLAEWSVRRFVSGHAELLAVISLAIFLVLTYAGSLSVLVRRRTKLLRQALEDREKADKEMEASRTHIENLERTGLVGQMSTVIAHELKQPLGAVNNYANALLRRLKREDFNKERFEVALSEIVKEASRASEIVERVRSYAKHDYPPRNVEDLSTIILSAIETFRRSRNSEAAVVVRMRAKSLAEVDAWEIELMVLNLLKNAADAIVTVPRPRIDVVLEPASETEWRLTVGDNGPYLTDEQLGRFFKPLQTSKGDAGMGLGLSIVANIAERHAGNITVARNGERGVKFTFLFPKVNDPTLADKVPWPTGDEDLLVYQAGGRGAVFREKLNAQRLIHSRGPVDVELAAFDEEGMPKTVHTAVLFDVARVMENGEPISHTFDKVLETATTPEAQRKAIEREVDRFVSESLDIDESDVPKNA